MNKINREEIAKRLKEERKNPASDEVLHVFATRRRTRDKITLNSLYLYLKDHGFTNRPRRDYLSVIKCMVNLGLGKPMISKAGNIYGIKDIKYTLQSIGALACDIGHSLKPNKFKHRFEPITPQLNLFHDTTQESEAMTLTFGIHGKQINLVIPPNLNREEIADLIGRLHA